ncbi:MAG: DUF3566 domain-containing protein [Microbacteriaceae bacterium]
MSSSVAEKLAKKSSRGKSTKQVRLRLVYIDFWSSLKLSFLVGICLGIVVIVGSFLIWTVLNQIGVFDSASSLLKDIAGSSNDLKSFLALNQVMGFSIIVAILNTVVITVLGAVFALLYNLSVKITGGLLVGFQNN